MKKSGPSTSTNRSSMSKRSTDDKDDWSPPVSKRALARQAAQTSAAKNKTNETTDEKTTVKRVGLKRLTIKQFDGDAPRQATGAYGFFLSQKRDELRQTKPNATLIEISRATSEGWKALTDQQKKPFYDKAAAALAKYNQEMLEYKKTDKYQQYMQAAKDFKLEQKNGGDTGKTKKRSIFNRGADIQIFSDAFLKHNQEQDLRVRELKKSVGALTDEYQSLRRRILALENAHHKLDEVVPDTKPDINLLKKYDKLKSAIIDSLLAKNTITKVLSKKYSNQPLPVLVAYLKSISASSLGRKQQIKHALQQVKLKK